ncbi:ABC transporter permease [Nocardioides sp. zg-536]|uniref:ABC transporter permease n=1 Tax=Nocardioides faecalis TaxID=2803858 RepID=A0A939BUK3_9ACTN|nr:ABC transporter permease [Nocardioides faecalis]MBM9458592.1 ABC transporter permease [Nocardioides faecalis]MBS4752923.1 ABC transporter permease [Nocardioides faecalis]QVI58591.1 ABC transporter permease [Nocardioides faecalis]
MSVDVVTQAARPTADDGTTTTAAASPPRHRRRGAGHSTGDVVLRVLRLLSPVILVGVWQLASATGVLPASTLPPPSVVAETAGWLWESGQLSEAILVSLRRAAIGFLLGGGIALVLGTVVGLSRIGDALLDPYMQMLRMLPLFGLVPLFIIWFGIKEEPKIYLVALFSLVPLYLNLVAALRGVDPDLKEVARALRLNRLERVRHLYVPAVLPGVLVGLRQSLGAALVALVVAEQVNAGAGLGYLINNARDFLRTDIIVVALLCYAVLGLLTDALVRALERAAVRWRDEGVQR